MSLRKSLFLILPVLFLAFTATAQIRAVEKFLDDHEDLQKFFIYQSTLRILNQSGNQDFNRLIKNIRKINVYIAEDGSANVSRESHQQMLRDLEAESFETLVSAKQEGMLLNLMSREIGNDAYYVLAASEGNDFALLEMDGKLDLRYLQSLEDVNFMELRKLVGQENNGNTPEENRN
jgi:hypothetical protein